MKINTTILVAILLLASAASADYLQSIRQMDQRLVCVIAWFAPAVIVFLFVSGAFLLVTGSPANRVMGKSLMMNAVIGTILVVGFITLSVFVVPGLDVGACYAGTGAAGP